jgi:hypothetical protein
MTYYIAFPTESGAWDIVETFEAEDDAAAEAYAEEEYDGQDWWVLNSKRENING